MWKYLLILALVRTADNITVIEVDNSDVYTSINDYLPQETPNDRPIIGQQSTVNIFNIYNMLKFVDNYDSIAFKVFYPKNWILS